MLIKPHRLQAVHPGNWLKTMVIQPNGLSVTEAASLLGVTRATLSRLLNCRAGVSLSMANRFGSVFCIPPDALIRMQTAWDFKGVRA